LNIWIDLYMVKVQPDAFVIPTIKCPTGYGAILVHGAAKSVSVKMDAVAVPALIDQIGLTQTPVDNPFPNILLGEGKGNATTGGFADLDAAVAVYFHFFLKPVLVVFGILEHDPIAAFAKLLSQPLSYLPLALVQLLDRNNPPFTQKLNKGVEERSCLQGFGGVGIQPTVGVE
jgi:hypothetical protein